MPDYMVRMRFRWANTRQRLLDSGNSPWLLRKAVVRLITALLALVSFVSFAAAIPSWNRVFVHMSGPSKGDWQDGIPIAPLVLAFLYNIFATMSVFRTARPVPWALESVIDFLVWAALIPGILFAAWGGVFNLWQKSSIQSNGTVVCGAGMNAYSRECFPELYRIGELELAGIVFALLVWMLHIFLSTHGIIERCSRPRRVPRPRTEGFKEIENVSQPAWANFSRRPSFNSRSAAAPWPSPPPAMPTIPRVHYR